MRSEAGAVAVVELDVGRLNLPPGREVRRVDVAAAVRAATPLGEIHECPSADRSEAIYRALLRGEWSEAHFPSLGGLAFRTLQAKRSGLAFANTRIIVHDTGSSRAERESRHSWPTDPDDLVVDFMQEFVAESHGVETLAAASPLVTVGIAHFNLGEFLPAALESLAAQTHANLEIIVIDDGSTRPESVAAIDRLEREHPRVRFLRQANAGIGATRNRLLAEARGELFIPMDADNLARPNMVEAFARAMHLNSGLAAMTCYFRAFTEDPDHPVYAYRPTGGPHAMACIRNVYGDANGVFRTAAFRAAGGYETDRGTSCEDWEAYVKLVHAGHRIGVVPEYLFDYRHREAGFSRATNWYANHQRVLRQFAGAEWPALLGFQQENQRLRERLNAPQYRIADGLLAPLKWLKRLVRQ